MSPTTNRTRAAHTALEDARVIARTLALTAPTARMVAAAAEVVPRMFRITICPGSASVRPSRRTIPLLDLRCDGGEN